MGIRWMTDSSHKFQVQDDCWDFSRCLFIDTSCSTAHYESAPWSEHVINPTWVTESSAHLRSEMSDRHGPASRTEDTICPTAQR